MKKRSFVILIASTGAVAALALVIILGSMVYWQKKQPAFESAPKLVFAVQAYSRDRKALGQPLPATVTLRELISGGYVAAGDVRAFDGAEVTISTSIGPPTPTDVLMQVRLPDGSVTALMGDGSVQTLPR